MGGLAFITLPPEDRPPAYSLARCTAYNIKVQTEPDPKAEIIRTLYRNQIVTVLETVEGANGPEGNPRWFRLLDGFAHTAYLQEVRYRFNPVEYSIPEGGWLMEVTVPYTQSHYAPSDDSQLLYRLYYQAVFWAVETVVDTDGNPWYALMDDRLHYKYYVHAEHLRPFRPEELAPISPDMPPDRKRIEVDLTKQIVTAFEAEGPIFTATISSGWLRRDPKPGEGRTVTPIGRFHVFQKVPSRHMGNGRLTSNVDAYELPGVPWCSFFHEILGTAFHGAYWHNDFGRPNSQGCINMRPDDARWLFRWIAPAGTPEMNPPSDLEGTEVYLHD